MKINAADPMSFPGDILYFAYFHILQSILHIEHPNMRIFVLQQIEKKCLLLLIFFLIKVKNQKQLLLQKINLDKILRRKTFY